MASVQPPISRRQPAVDQIGRQMHGDEGELEAAGEEAEHQQHVGAMAERLRQRLLAPIAAARAAARARGACAARSASATAACTSSSTPAKITSVVCQPIGVHQAHGERREQELAERARRRAGAERERAPAFRHELAERADHHRQRAAGQAEADQHAGREMRASPASSHRPSGRGRAHRGSRRRSARAARRSCRRSRRRTAGRRPRAGSGWRATARTRRGPSPFACDSGVRKKPSAERGPNVMTAIAQPHSDQDDRRAPRERFGGAGAVDIGCSRKSRRRRASAT